MTNYKNIKRGRPQQFDNSLIRDYIRADLKDRAIAELVGCSVQRVWQVRRG